jgi:hypothetical protein
MRIHDGRIGAAIAGAMLIALPAIELLTVKSAPATAHVITLLLGVALVFASAAGLRLD